MDIENRYFNLLSFLIKEGAIYFMHYTLINFGNANKPKHFFISQSGLTIGDTNALFNPCTSLVKDKDIFIFNLSDEINLKDKRFAQTYVLLSVTKSVRLSDFTKTEFCVYKGIMKEETLKLYRKAKQDFILKQYNKRIYS